MAGNGFLLFLADSCVFDKGGSRTPRRRGANPRRGATYKFNRFARKLHEIKKILVRSGEGTPGGGPLYPPLFDVIAK